MPDFKKLFCVRFELLQFIALTLLWVVSCQVFPTKVLPTPKALTSESILKILMERKNHLADFKSFVRTSISKYGSTKILKQVFLIKNSLFIRIDTLSIFGNPISIFIHDPQQTLIYDPSENRTYRGPEIWRTVKDVVGITLDVDETIALFSGNIPKLEQLRIESIHLNMENKSYELEMQNPISQKQFRIEVDAFLLVPIRLEKRFSSDLMYIVQWEDYKSIDNYFFSHSITLSRPDSEETLAVEYLQPQINLGIPRDAFTLSLESG